MSTPAPLCLLGLPYDVQIQIWERCDRATLHALCCSSRALNLACTPQLYKVVDLSIHNRGRLPNMWPPMAEFWADEHWQMNKVTLNGEMVLDPVRQRVIAGQHSFLHSLIVHPERGRHVQKFTWSLLFGSRENETDVDEEDLDYPDSETFRVLEKLENVRNLDFASLHYETRPGALQCPSRLFPSATAIRLVGWMNYDLAYAILHTPDPTKLKMLALNNVQHWGQLEGGKRQADGLDCYGEESVTADGKPDRVFPGPMRGLLKPLEGRCDQLETLYLRNAGQSSRGEGWPEDADEEVYREWGMFINSVRGSLRNLTFEHGPEHIHHGICGSRTVRPCIWPHVRPMDLRFDKYILSAILGAPWPRMERLEIRGVGQTGYVFPPPYSVSVEELRDCLPSTAEIVIVEELERPCERYIGE